MILGAGHARQCFGEDRRKKQLLERLIEDADGSEDEGDQATDEQT